MDAHLITYAVPQRCPPRGRALYGEARAAASAVARARQFIEDHFREPIAPNARATFFVATAESADKAEIAHGLPL